jgi:hypothetical protein
MASDARQHNGRESFQPRADCQANQPLKAGLFRVSFFGRFFCGARLRHFLRRRSLTAAANIVEPCGVPRWTLRRFLRHPSLELAANIVGKIVGRCGNFAATVVGASLTNR